MKHIWNLPNILTMLRVIAVPFFIYLLFDHSFTGRLIALLLFAFASITDFLDGYLARKWRQETEFGKFLDPLADKALVLGAFVTFIFLSDQVQIWMVLCIIGRDMLLTLMRSIAIRRGTSLRTSIFGKLKTAFQMLSIVLILLSFLTVSYRERTAINNIYYEASLRGYDPSQVAYDHLLRFMNGEIENVYYGLAAFVPYYLMLFTTFLTVVSGLRYLLTNYKLFIPGELPGKYKNR
jgi:cardiolipin synthase